MDFFEAQALAKKRTTRLVVLFVLAVLGIIAVGYFAFIFLVAMHGGEAAVDGSRIERDHNAAGQFDLWQPDTLLVFSVITIGVVGFSALSKWFQLRAGGRAVAEMVGARLVPLQTADLRERQLLNVVEEMAIASGLPLPDVYVLDEETGINAFAAGLTTSDAVVAVTRGTLEKLNRDELQGVVAHEFSHILNGDMRLNVRLTAILHGILVIGLIGRGIISSLRFSRPRRNSKEGNGVVVVLIMGFVLLCLGYVGYFFGRLIQAAVSRQREFLADASAVQFTRNPGGIVGALKKIGGYALGSHIQSTRASELSHFFFAQGFRSSFGGLWATHPPLDVRIRAVDASFDGKYFEPPALIDVTVDTWARQRAVSSSAPRRVVTPLNLVASIGALETAHTERAHHVSGTITESLRSAVRAPQSAAAVVCGLLLESDPDLRARQRNIIRNRGSDRIAAALAPLENDLIALPPEARLPLLLLTPPALRQLSPAELARFLDALDELVHADQQVSLFEFALQKVLTHHLDLAARPDGRRELYSPADVSPEISTVLSFGARLSAADEPQAAQAFHAGSAGFAGLHPPLVLQPSGFPQLDRLDAALDKLALAYGPVKKRVLTALATTVSHDGRIDPAEAELLRALASALDCPIPPA